MNDLSPLPSTTSGESAVARLSHKHEQVINWLLENPHRSLRECADAFGYTQGWLSQLIHSDIFQAQLRARQEQVFVQIAQDIPTKLKGLADVAIEKVTRLVEQSENPDVIVDVFDKTLNRLGYAPQKSAAPAAAAPQVNVININKADLAEARALISAPGQTFLEAPRGENSTASVGGIVLPTAAPVSAEN